MPEQPTDIAIMLDDPELVRLVASWPKIAEKDREDYDYLGQVANVHQGKIKSVVMRAKLHNLIYDNGKINEFAQKYISTLVAIHLKKKVK